MTETRMTMTWLHIYAQPWWHQPSRIHGTPQALVAVRDAIDHALHKGFASAEVMAADGESYRVEVQIRSQEKLMAAGLPYTAADR